MIALFPDETVVTRSDGDKVILTTHRIWYENKESGRSYNQSIMLEHITSCENHSYSNNFLLSLAAFFFIIGIYAAIQENSSTFGFTLLISIVLTGFYFATRQNLIVIGSPSTKMKIYVTGMKREDVLSFINKIEQTKNQRVISLKK